MFCRNGISAGNGVGDSAFDSFRFFDVVPTTLSDFVSVGGADCGGDAWACVPTSVAVFGMAALDVALRGHLTARGSHSPAASADTTLSQVASA